MSMYPSLEDMKATEMIKAQVQAMSHTAGHKPQLSHRPSAAYPSAPSYSVNPSAPAMTLTRPGASAYPSLVDFMGMELTEEMIRLNMPEYSLTPANNQQNSVVQRNNVGVNVIAPISGSNSAIVKSMTTHGVRKVVLKKDAAGKVGLRVRAMNTGVFVCLVMDGSPAATGGLRFGDQILQIDGEDMAGMTVQKVHKIFKGKKPGDTFELAVRDRPFERTVTLVRSSLGCVGFQFRDGKIVNIVKDSSAARNGLLTDHNLLEINGRNVIGLKDKEITKIIQAIPGNALSVTIMPSFLYSHMVKEMCGSLFGKMDHSDDF